MSEETQNPEVTSTENQPTELELLKERAVQMGISFHPSIGVDKLRAKVEAAIQGVPDPTATDEHVQEAPAPEPDQTANDDQVLPAPASAPVMSEYQKTQMQRMEAMKLMRVVVSCMNPAKQAWEGEIFTVSNDIVGTVKKFVPFNVDTGYHIPHIIYEQLMERMCQIFVSTTDPVPVSKPVAVSSPRSSTWLCFLS